jgi:hypothetical protein
MIFNCQRKPSLGLEWHIHRVEAPDEATARVMMFNRSGSWAWLEHDRTEIWAVEEWVAT